MEQRYTFTIGGVEMAIISGDSEERVNKIIKKVTDDVTDLIEENVNITTAAASVLTALDYLDETMKIKDDMERLRTQISAYIEDAENAHNEANEAKRQIDLLRREIDSLRIRLNAKNQ